MFKMMKIDWSAAKYYYKRTLLVPLCMLVVGALSAIYLVPMGAFLMFSISVNPFAVEGGIRILSGCWQLYRSVFCSMG
ncbi:MAG TPA: hypothetical protein DCZ91_01160 [Lachnospiraceae bacterium]|nr:hypothetical protein [Lachnospiraceae bacterium]